MFHFFRHSNRLLKERPRGLSCPQQQRGACDMHPIAIDTLSHRLFSSDGHAHTQTPFLLRPHSLPPALTVLAPPTSPSHYVHIPHSHTRPYASINQCCRPPPNTRSEKPALPPPPPPLPAPPGADVRRPPLPLRGPNSCWRSVTGTYPPPPPPPPTGARG